MCLLKMSVDISCVLLKMSVDISCVLLKMSVDNSCVPAEDVSGYPVSLVKICDNNVVLSRVYSREPKTNVFYARFVFTYQLRVIFIP